MRSIKILRKPWLSRRLFEFITLSSFICVVSWPLAAASPTIGTTAVTPRSIPTNSVTAMMVTSVIADPGAIATGVVLQQLDGGGRVVGILGSLKDDGTNGDQIPGDKTYTLGFRLAETRPGFLFLRVSAAFRNNLKRVASSPMTINVVGPPATVISLRSSGEVNSADGSAAFAISSSGDTRSFAVSGDATQVQDFESVSDLAFVTSQLPGLAFSNTIALASGAIGGSLNEFEFPPLSGFKVVSDEGGPISITFATPLTKFGGFFTYATPLLVEAFDATNNLVASVKSSFSNNLALSGEPLSEPNELLELTSIAGISKVRITGNPAGGSFTMDDLLTTTGTPCSQEIVDDKVNFEVQRTDFNSTSVVSGPAGTLTIEANLSNKTSQAVLAPIKAVVTNLTGGNRLLSATEGDGRVGSKQLIDTTGPLDPNETASAKFVIGLVEKKFTFTVSVESCVLR